MLFVRLLMICSFMPSIACNAASDLANVYDGLLRLAESWDEWDGRGVCVCVRVCVGTMACLHLN